MPQGHILSVCHLKNAESIRCVGHLAITITVYHVKSNRNLHSSYYSPKFFPKELFTLPCGLGVFKSRLKRFKKGENSLLARGQP